MTKDILVTVKGLMNNGPEEEDSVEVTTRGHYFFKNGKHYLLFDENGEKPEELVSNRIVINGNHVDVSKKGAIDTQMSFEEGKKLNSIYQTPFGQMELGIITGQMELNLSEEHLELKLNYQLEINNEYLSDNQLRILAESVPECETV